MLYWLHGYTSTDRELISGIRQNLNVRLAMDSLLREGAAKEMIIVMPNAYNAFAGSFFANSPVTGRWEDFIVRDAALRRLRIAVDAGEQDGFPDIPANVRALDSLLTAMGIAHHAEIYQGGHVDRVRARVVTGVLPFFSRVLC